MPASRIACLYLPVLQEQALRRSRGADAAPRLHPRSPGALRSAQEALAELAGSVSSRVQEEPDAVLLEVGDLALLYPSEQGLLSTLQERAQELGLTLQMAVADRLGTARALARSLPGVTLVPSGADRAALAPLPLHALAPEQGLLEDLQRWGVRTLGELAALPRARLAPRLGAAGVELHRRACGEDPAQLTPTPLQEQVEEAIELEDPLDNLEPLAFVLRGLIDRAVRRLALRGLACRGYELRLDLVPRGREERRVPLTTPTREVAALLELGRINLAAQPPAAPVRGLTLRTTAAVRRPAQLSLFEPTRVAPERLATLLARLQALCGEGRSGAPELVDSHLPGLCGLRPFSEELAAPTPRPPAVALLSPHVFRPPRPAEVLLTNGRPVGLRGGDARGSIVVHGGPYRVRAGLLDPVQRDYYDVELDSGHLYRLFQDLSTACWFVDARYD